MNHFLPRRLLAVVFSALLGVVVLSAVTAGPAAASTPMQRISFEPGSTINIVDDEPWPYANETASMDLSRQGNLYVWPQHLVDGPSQFAEKCAGDEVRIELFLTAELSTAYKDWVWVTATAYMYEGASCYSWDLDGEETIGFWIGPGTSGPTQTFTVRNEDEGGDSATIKLKLKNAFYLSPFNH